MVLISGVHSDPDPSPGIGIARSLKEAFPDWTLCGVDYSIRSSGLHHQVFDKILLQPVWSELDLETYASQIDRILSEQTNRWISGLDVETDWLARRFSGQPNLLAPNVAAQQAVRKPVIPCAHALGMRVPEFLPATSSPTELHGLGRRSGWRLWVKGKYHEAYSAVSFPELRRQIRALETHWPLDQIFVQEHISGLERSITFAAYDGRLLDAVEVEKRSVTSQGKTWAASVTHAPAKMVTRLAKVLNEARWTGGGEVEFIRDHAGTDWLIDFNPRFPAYIYGVTLCGHNLPAQLASVALKADFHPGHDAASQFVRVVHEIPVREGYPIPRITHADNERLSAAKHPSFQPELVRRLSIPEKQRSEKAGNVTAPFPAFIANWKSPLSTPLRIREFSGSDSAIESLASALAGCRATPRIVPALSVKTDPDPTLARAFLKRGWWAEAISLRELEWARDVGFADPAIILNGPVAAMVASEIEVRPAVVFADSAESFASLVRSHGPEMIGIRVRAGGNASRFGVDLAHPQTFRRIAEMLRECGQARRLGIHVHFPSDVSGPARWKDLIDQALIWADALSQTTGVTFSVFDIGGGWHPEDFRNGVSRLLPDLQAHIAEILPSVDTIILEPGKAVAADSAWLATRVLEVRGGEAHDSGEVVVDASIADLPMAQFYAHHILQVREGKCLGWLLGGSQRILGAICMETDVLADGIDFPVAPKVGDELLFSSAGGYNASMAWHFAAGVRRDP